MRFRSWALCMWVAIVVSAYLGTARAEDEKNDDSLRSAVTAPAGTRNLNSTLGGGYFVDENLLQRYEALKTRLIQIRQEITSGNANREAALKSLTQIETESKQLRDELEKNKVLVSAFQVFSQKSEQSFPLGEEKLVIVTGDNVTIRGWDGPGLKCVVEKIILAKQPPEKSEFEAIQLNHQLTVAEDKVGLTREQRDAQEVEFLASEDGRKLTDEQKQRRKAFVDEIHHSFDDYTAFQGRKANTIELTGLSFEEGNRNLTMEIKSPDGGGLVSSQWQRHATLTVYVPPCRSLAVRGCQSGLDVQAIEADLILTTHDSRDRQYEGAFKVHGVKGNVTIDQVPVRHLSTVTGNVRFQATNEFVNSGTHHENGTRTYSPYVTHATRIDHIDGHLQARFVRTNLRLDAIQGSLDVINQFGTTHLSVDAVDKERTHRVLSDCGEIRVEGEAEVLTKTPIYAFTECGRLHTNVAQNVLEDLSFSTGNPRRGWHGFVTPSTERFDFERLDRPRVVLENGPRSAGLDLISHAGSVTILTAGQEE